MLRVDEHDLLVLARPSVQHAAAAKSTASNSVIVCLRSSPFKAEKNGNHVCVRAKLSPVKSVAQLEVVVDLLLEPPALGLDIRLLLRRRQRRLQVLGAVALAACVAGQRQSLGRHGA